MADGGSARQLSLYRDTYHYRQCGQNSGGARNQWRASLLVADGEIELDLGAEATLILDGIGSSSGRHAGDA